MRNIDVANDYLTKADEAIKRRDLELADRYTALAAVVMQGHTNEKISAVAKAIGRLAGVVNAGKSWL